MLVTEVTINLVFNKLILKYRGIYISLFVSILLIIYLSFTLNISAVLLTITLVMCCSLLSYFWDCWWNRCHLLRLMIFIIVYAIGLVILEQYSLQKLWVDIKDANRIKVRVMFPWQIEQQTLLTDKGLFEAFEQFRVKGYKWVGFIITTDDDFVPSFFAMVRPSNKVVDVNQNCAPEAKDQFSLLD